MKLPSLKEAHIKAMAVSLEATNTVLPSSLCADPILPLVATLAIFKATLDSHSIEPKVKEQVAKAGDYFSKQLATVSMLVDNITPTVAVFFDAIPPGEGGSWRGPGKTLLFDITHRLGHKVQPTKLAKLDGSMCPYFTALMVAALAHVGVVLVMPEGMQITTMTREVFNNILPKEDNHNYDKYSLFCRKLL